VQCFVSERACLNITDLTTEVESFGISGHRRQHIGRAEIKLDPGDSAEHGDVWIAFLLHTRYISSGSEVFSDIASLAYLKEGVSCGEKMMAFA
jgi:hypothetical protein